MNIFTKGSSVFKDIFILLLSFLCGFIFVLFYSGFSSDLEEKENLIKSMNYNEEIVKETVMPNTRTIVSTDTVNHDITYKYSDGTHVTVPDSIGTDNF